MYRILLNIQGNQRDMLSWKAVLKNNVLEMVPESNTFCTQLCRGWIMLHGSVFASHSNLNLHAVLRRTPYLCLCVYCCCWVSWLNLQSLWEIAYTLKSKRLKNSACTYERVVESVQLSSARFSLEYSCLPLLTDEKQSRNLKNRLSATCTILVILNSEINPSW